MPPVSLKTKAELRDFKMSRKGLEVKRTCGGREKLNALIKSEKNSTFSAKFFSIIYAYNAIIFIDLPI